MNDSYLLVESYGASSERTSKLIRLAVDGEGTRQPPVERQADGLFQRAPGTLFLAPAERAALLVDHIQPMLHRELRHRSLVPDDGGFRTGQVGWFEVGRPA